MNADSTIVASLGAADATQDDVSMFAQVAFARANRGNRDGAGARHLSLLPRETLELDLSDPAQRLFGGYELLELIGEGGMGVVYRARQIGLDREVAVKLLAAGPWASSEFVERFRREAQNAARMQHPNIVAIYEVGDAEDLQFFSMRLVRGDSLAALLKDEGKLAPMRAAQLLRTIAEAVDYAHRLGVLHLDLKPANVLLDENGVPHVADFGLARRLDQGSSADNTEVSGTPSYMAPEQATAGVQSITPATDIWGLGAVLYELVTGSPPFLGSSPHGTLRLVVEGSLVCPLVHTPALPLDLKAIILKCMSRNVADRYPSGRALADDLARFENGYMVKARPLNTLQRSARWARREPKVVVSALLALLALSIGFAATTVQWRRAEAQSQRAQQQTQLAQTNAETSNTRLWASRRDAAFRLQADGKAFAALPALISNIEEQEKGGASAAMERREVGMILHQGVTLIDRMIIADGRPLTTALSPDGSLLAVGLDDISVRWYDTATLTERGRVDLLDEPTSDRIPRAPRLLRFVDNHVLRVTLDWFENTTSPSNRDTILVDLDQAQVIAPPPAFANLADAAYSADGHYALLFDREGKGQYWQVEPWQPLSARDYVSGVTSAIGWTVGTDGRHAISFRQSHTGLRIVDARHPTDATNVELLSNKVITAWQDSHDGAQMAIGDDNGNVYLVDVKTAKVRALPLPSGGAVTWLAFSEDDAWCAAARHDGDAFAFDAVSGDPLHSGMLQHDFELHHIELSHRESLLVASGAGDVALWRLPQQGTRGGGSPAIRIAANPTSSARAGLFWSGVSLSAGLLATADMDGEVRLWRLPQDTDTGAHAAARFADHTPFDGTYLVDTAANHVRVVSVDRRHATDWVALPQPATFAELVGRDRTLIAVSGHALYAFDGATMRPRYAPVQLPDTPNYLAISPDGTNMVMAFGRNQATGFELVLQAYDPATGRQRAGSAVVHGPARQLEFSPDGSRLLVVGSLNGASEVFDSTTLVSVGVYPHRPERPVIAATFAQTADELWLAERAQDESESDAGQLLRWEPKSNQVLETRALAGSKPIGVHMLAGKPLLFTDENFVLDPGGPDQRSGPILRGGEVTNTFSVTADGALIAHADGRRVQLYDAATFEAIGSPFLLNWRYDDAVLRMAFDPQGERLLALPSEKHANVWSTHYDRRALEDLHRDAELLAPAPRAGRVLRIADTAERAYLRSNDPGAWPDIPARPALPVARWIDNMPVPARTAGTDPLQLDLTEVYSTTIQTFRSAADMVLMSTRGVPIGLARLDGIDYDIRGGVNLRPRSLTGNGVLRAGDVQPKVSGIHVPAVPIAALHVLMLATYAIPEPNEREYARIRLHYRDGSEAVLSIHTQRDVPGMSAHDRPTPVGWTDNDFVTIGVPRILQFADPRLPNPHPQRIVESLDLEASDTGWSEPVFFAITAEPVIASGDSRK